MGDVDILAPSDRRRIRTAQEKAALLAEVDAEGGKVLADEVADIFAASPEVLKLRLHLPEPYDNAVPNPPAPNVAHVASPDRANLAIMEIAFANPLTRRAFYASDVFQSTIAGQSLHVLHATAFAVSGVYTYVRDKALTTAGLRGSRAAQLIGLLGANNQVSPDVKHLLQYGKTR